MVVTASLEPLSIDPLTILRLLPHGVLVVGSDWRVLYANPEAERIFGTTGTTLWERCPDLAQSAFASALRYAMSDQTELLTDGALPSVGWCQARARPMPQGGLLITMRQVHAGTVDTGQAKQALLIGEIGDALTREESLKAALERSAHAIVRNLGAALARIWTVDEAEHTLTLCAQAGIDPGDRSQERLHVGESKVGQIADDGIPYLTNDVKTDLQVGTAAWIARERIVAFAGYPLRIEDRIVGVMAMYSRRPIDHDLLNSLSSLADALALGIERKGAAEGRRRAEERMRTQAEQLAVLNELGKQLAAELDVDVLVEQVATTATRIAGAARGAFFHGVAARGDRLRYDVRGSGCDEFATVLPRIMALGPGRLVRIDDVRVPATPYSELPITSFLAVPVFGRSGKAIGALVFGHDRAGAFTEATEQLIVGVASTAAIAMDNARLFSEARTLIAALEQTNRELDQFAYVASHDLKAPLRGIANLSQWIEDDLGDRMSEETRQHMVLLRGRVVRLENLIGGILEYSRAARDHGDRTAIGIEALAAEAWELLSPPPTAQLIIEPDLPRAIGARTQLQQIVMNLLGNAIKYNKDREIHVRVGVRKLKTTYEFFVSDDGVGIAPEFHDKIWGLFQTLERRDILESTGIGLAIVRKIVEAQGGRAWVESGEGSGVTFVFTWPTDRDGEPHG